MAEATCPWRIHWGASEESHTRCTKPAHLPGDPKHTGPSGVLVGQTITWLAGDRREYAGSYPGPCELTRGCILHTGHLRRCAT